MNNAFKSDSQISPPIVPRRDSETSHQPGAERVGTGGLSPHLAEQILFFSRTYKELKVEYDQNARSIWCYLRPSRNTCFTPSMIRELAALHHAIQSLIASQPPGQDALVNYYIQRSSIPGIYNTGGDLGFLIDRISHGDREAIRHYAYGCTDAVFQIATGFGSGIVSVCLVEGDALGGGLEGAICCNYIIAERNVQFGLPEILFNCFPGMGAYSMLTRRIGLSKAERMILSGKLYTAAEMYEIGVVDLVVERGAGEQELRNFVSQRKYGARCGVYRARQRINPLTLEELRDVTDIWIETVMKLGPADLRRMKHLQAAQARRLQRNSLVR